MIARNCSHGIAYSTADEVVAPFGGYTTDNAISSRRADQGAWKFHNLNVMALGSPQVDRLYSCRVNPLELSDCKPEPSERLLLAASAIVMDDLDQFPDYRLDTLHFDRTIATARLQSENF